MSKIEVLRKMVEGNPAHGDGWYLLGLEYAEAEMTGEALEAFSNAIKFGDAEVKQRVMLELARLSQNDQPDLVGNQDTLPEALIIDEEADDSEETETRDDEEGGNLIPFKVLPGGKTKHTANTENIPSITFADVGGLEELQEIIRMKIIKPFLVPGLFEKFKKKIGGGILLYGPPGCGKTFIAKATAGECSARFMPVHITDILDPYIGVSEQNVKDIFTTARADKPAILFFDELDALGFNRAKASSYHLRPTVDQLLSEIEGIDSNTDRILIIGATNMPWDVDPAFKRPGRFDRMIFVPPPDSAAREVIFRLKLTGRPVQDMDYRLLAEKSELYSGADIEHVVETAAENVINEIMKTSTERPISVKDILAVIEKTKPSTIEWLRTIKNYVKYANQGGLYDEVERYLARVKKI